MCKLSGSRRRVSATYLCESLVASTIWHAMDIPHCVSCAGPAVAEQRPNKFETVTGVNSSHNKLDSRLANFEKQDISLEDDTVHVLHSADGNGGLTLVGDCMAPIPFKII